MLKRILCWSALALQCTLSTAYAAEKLTLGLITTTTPDDIRKRWQAFADDLGKATGMEVQTVVSANYDEIVNGLRDNKIQVAWMGSKSALAAVEDGKSTIFAQMVKADGSKGYVSYLIVPANSPIKSIDDVVAQPKRYTFADGEASSTSGYLVPAYYLFSKRKIDVNKLFSRVTKGNHQAHLKAIVEGQVDVATYNSEELDRLKKEQPAQAKKVKVIWTSPQIPNDPILYRKDLSPALKSKLEDFFLNYGKAKSASTHKQNLLAMLELSGFQRSNDAQLKSIADLTLFSILRANMDDTKLTDAQKAQKFNEVSARFGKLSMVLESARLK